MTIGFLVMLSKQYLHLEEYVISIQQVSTDNILLKSKSRLCR